MKVIIAGSRHFRDYEFMKRMLDTLFSSKVPEEIISGGQVSIDEKTGEKYGADYLGEQYAAERGIPVKKFKADWATFGLSAGPIRNTRMGEYCTPHEDGCVVFWNKKSKGSGDMVKKAKKYHLKLREVIVSV
jgi:hypothetical protein